MAEWLPEIDAWRTQGIPVAIATVTKVDGSAPRPVGARLVVNADGEMAGSVSGGCVENAVIYTALEVITSGKPVLEHYGISDDMAWNVGLSCGGAIDVFIEPLGSLDADTAYDQVRQYVAAREEVALATVIRGASLGTRMIVRADSLDGSTGDEAADVSIAHVAREVLTGGEAATVSVGERDVYVEVYPLPDELIIFGAVHAAQPLARYAQDLGYVVTVVDARTALATRERFPNVENLLAMWPDAAYDELTVGEHSWIAILSHDPKFDEPAILGALATDARYIGTVGSRKTNEDRRERLKSAGVSNEDLARLHGPIGLNIGGRTPEEMAIAIIAEMIAIRYGRDGGSLRDASGSIRGKD